MKFRWMALVIIGFMSPSASATSWAYGLDVVQIGTYQSETRHFVWFSSSIPECPSVASFNHEAVGGKAMFATLTTALVSKRKVDVQLDACNIVEIYLKQ